MCVCVCVCVCVCDRVARIIGMIYSWQIYIGKVNKDTKESYCGDVLITLC